jgi:hypothetical protein
VFGPLLNLRMLQEDVGADAFRIMLTAAVGERRAEEICRMLTRYGNAFAGRDTPAPSSVMSRSPAVRRRGDCCARVGAKATSYLLEVAARTAWLAAAGDGDPARPGAADRSRDARRPAAALTTFWAGVVLGLVGVVAAGRQLAAGKPLVAVLGGRATPWTLGTAWVAGLTLTLLGLPPLPHELSRYVYPAMRFHARLNFATFDGVDNFDWYGAAYFAAGLLAYILTAVAGARLTSRRYGRGGWSIVESLRDWNCGDDRPRHQILLDDARRDEQRSGGTMNGCCGH